MLFYVREFGLVDYVLIDLREERLLVVAWTEFKLFYTSVFKRFFEDPIRCCLFCEPRMGFSWVVF